MILATVITHKKDQALILDAIETALQCECDSIGILDTGLSPIDDGPVAKLVVDRYKTSLYQHRWLWKQDFSAARNESLRITKELAFTHCFVCDSDERFVMSGDKGSLRKFMLENPADIYSVSDVSGDYAKYRIFNVETCGLDWYGPTHEVYPPKNYRIVKIPFIKFYEVPKDQEAYRNKCRRDIDILLEYTRHHKDDPRWWYYLAQSYEGLGEKKRAIEAYWKCARIWEGNYWVWKEESAWACFKIAQIYYVDGKYQEVIKTCAQGLARFGAMPELSWIMATSHFYLGDMLQARYWANNAICQGSYSGYGRTVNRVGFIFPDAHFQNPFDVLHHIALREGNMEEAKHWKFQYECATISRHGGIHGPPQRSEQTNPEQGTSASMGQGGDGGTSP